MANPLFQVKENAPGLFFVDETCIACDTCGGISPQHFCLTNSCSHAYVQIQPTTPDQIAACNQAMKKCPVQAIGTQ